jgi:hypothetical protein
MASEQVLPEAMAEVTIPEAKRLLGMLKPVVQDVIHLLEEEMTAGCVTTRIMTSDDSLSMTRTL